MAQKLNDFDITLAVQYYTDGLKAFNVGEEFSKFQATSWKSGWKDGEQLATVVGADDGSQEED